MSSLEIKEHSNSEFSTREYQELAIRSLELLNQRGGKIDVIRNIILMIKEFTGFEAVGIRLKEGNDYPYYEAFGFSEGFVQDERYLCAYDINEEILIDQEGRPVLECMCGYVISGKYESALNFFTEKG
ncbi:MAG: hypothetical protein SVR08_15855, partial [Spirochaetota bacterium]|nr:hypothetical protein [Spirochaetota bacterium]